ncbi:hypothetical protein [Halobellus rubicundus]|uniref:Zinc ribbon domain-containing protein n=1 Tax=Halobellus rubicundus TaxID=2996466 RepID=A0ABD5M8X0_9EURY
MSADADGGDRDGGAEATAPCDRCEMSIPVDAAQCPVCGYRPGGYSPRLLRAGEVAFAVAIFGSILIFVGGVMRLSLGVPTDILAQVAVVTPYTAGISGFFLYYLRKKRRATPTDSRIFGRDS